LAYGDLDPEYLRLYRRFVKAIKAYEIALQKRRAVRERMRNRYKVAKPPRRPVGSPADYRIPQEAPRKGRSTKKKKPFRVYMGKILGWVTFKETSPEIDNSADWDADFDVLALHAEISRHLWFNAKDEYNKHKRAFFDYALHRKRKPGQKRPPKRDYSTNLARAKDATNYGVDLQLLGVEGGEEKAIEEAAMHVEAACYKAWENYQNEPEPKSRAAIKELIVITAESMLYPLDGSPITQKMTDEINRLSNEGILKKE
jgi:hypothetical protein